MGSSGSGEGPAWGLYVHIPFCPYKCAYCDFVAVADGPRVRRWHAPYVEAVLREAAWWAESLAPPPPVSVYYGGGTPTLLGAEALAQLHRGLVARLGVPPEAEVTCEANPETVDPPTLRALRAAGFNRLSLGWQAMQPRLLAALGRRHGPAEAVAAVRAAREAGFPQVNVDLMYGLPGQTLEDFRASLEAALALGPEHVSVYGLQVEAGTPFASQAAQGLLELPGEEAEAAMFACARELLQASGYEHYEISNFALPGCRCRHNLLYWTLGDYLGLGIAAHSHWRGRRWANTRRLARYRAALDLPPGPWPWGPGEPLPPWVEEDLAPDAARQRSEAAFLGLRLLEGVDLAAFRQRWGVDLDAAFPRAVARLRARGLAEVVGGRLRLTPEALLVANLAFAEFV